MGIISDKELALELASLVVNAHDESLHVLGNEAVDKLLKTEPIGQARFLWIADVSDPVYRFWQLRDAKFLTPDCHVVFTGVNDCPDWADLVRLYGGLKFGSLFIMKMSPSTKPGVCPSQKGMYFK